MQGGGVGLQLVGVPSTGTCLRCHVELARRTDVLMCGLHVWSSICIAFTCGVCSSHLHYIRKHWRHGSARRCQPQEQTRELRRRLRLFLNPPTHPEIGLPSPCRRAGYGTTRSSNIPQGLPKGQAGTRRVCPQRRCGEHARIHRACRRAGRRTTSVPAKALW